VNQALCFVLVLAIERRGNAWCTFTIE